MDHVHFCTSIIRTSTELRRRRLQWWKQRQTPRRAAACRHCATSRCAAWPRVRIRRDRQSIGAIHIKPLRSSNNSNRPIAKSRVLSVYFVSVVPVLFPAPLRGQRLQWTKCSAMSVRAYCLERPVPRKCDWAGSGPLANNIYMVNSS